jgi:hypothetical protein
MRYTVVTPWIWAPYMEACAETCAFDEDSWLRVDNTKVNLGIQRSVNHGIDKMFRDETDWLIYMSATMRFGEPGGLDFIDLLEQHPTYGVIEARGAHDNDIWGWHLIAFNRHVVEKAGRWDENFHPAYVDDLDYSVRVRHACPDRAWDKMRIDARDAGAAHALHLTGIKIPGQSHIFYFKQKWGRHPDHHNDREFDRPFGDPANPVPYWPSVVIAGVTGSWNIPLPELEEYHGT